MGKSYFYFLIKSIFLKTLILPNLTCHCLHTITTMKKKETQTGLGRWTPWILSWSHFQGPNQEVGARTLPASDCTRQEGSSQLTNLTALRRPNQPHLKPTLFQVPGHSSVPKPSSLLSHQLFRRQQHWVIDVPINSSYLPDFSYKKTRFLSILLLSSLQSLSGSQSIIIGTGPPSVITQWKVPCIHIVEVRDGVTTTQE